jgi:RHH-type proline utilization regulon transcriptional repressor/proline dehydrogenase/delta 1-pyrroline-5-carboxylate dehydrogenase
MSSPFRGGKMRVTTQGVKLNGETQARLKSASAKLDRTSHWFMKKAILTFIEKVEAGAGIEEFVAVELLDKDTKRHSIARRLRKECGSNGVP